MPGVRGGRPDPFERCKMRRAQGTGGVDSDVGCDTGAFPVRLRDRSDRAACRQPDAEVIRDASYAPRVGSATRCLAHDRGALQVLQVVGELFGGRERALLVRMNTGLSGP